MQELLLNPTFHFIACGIITNAIIGFACYHLGRNNPSSAALERFFNFLLDHPYIFESVLYTMRREQQSSTTPNP